MEDSSLVPTTNWHACVPVKLQLRLCRQITLDAKKRHSLQLLLFLLSQPVPTPHKSWHHLALPRYRAWCDTSFLNPYVPWTTLKVFHFFLLLRSSTNDFLPSWRIQSLIRSFFHYDVYHIFLPFLNHHHHHHRPKWFPSCLSLVWHPGVGVSWTIS